MIATANKCFDNLDFQCAKDFYVKAYLSGMSRDSLCFFISGVYLKQGNLDTALVYNMACTTVMPHLYQKVLHQRATILSGLGMLDSIIQPATNQYSESPAKEKRDTSMILGASVNFIFSDYKTKDTPMLFKDTAFHLCVPGCGLVMHLTQKTKKEIAGFLPYHKTYIGGSIPINQHNSILKKDCFILSEVRLENRHNIFALSNFTSIGYEEGKKIHFTESFTLEKPFSINKGLLHSQLSGRLKWIDDFTLNETNAGLTLLYTKPVKHRTKKMFSFDLSYNWIATSNFIKYKMGYTDSLKALSGNEPNSFVYRYYFDSLCTIRADSNRVSMYWKSDVLPTGPWIYMKEKTVDLVSSAGGSFKINKNWQLNSSLLLKGKYFIEKVSWYTIDDPVLSFYQRDNTDFVLLLFDKQKEKLYFQSASDSRTFNPGDTVPVSYHQKCRIDGTLSIQMSTNYNVPSFGIFSISSWISKNVSTLNQYNFPIPLLNTSWGIYIEWRSDLWKHIKKK